MMFSYFISLSLSFHIAFTLETSSLFSPRLVIIREHSSLSLICKSPKINSCSQIISHWIHRPIEKHFGKHCKEETIWLVSGNVSSIFSIENSSKYLENASPNYWHLTGCPALNKLFSKYLGSGILIACTLSYWVNICSILINLSE